MNDLCIDTGWKSINHYGEELCGDHVDIVDQGENSAVIVLADGLGSGVKASILSTLTSKIISTMMAQGLSLDECVNTIAATLPICSVRGVAYSTFTIMHVIDLEHLHLIQYDNPLVIMIRDGEIIDYPTKKLHFDNKVIYSSEITMKEGDIFIAMSDGCPHAGMGKEYNFGWQREDIAAYMQCLALVGHNAKTLATMLVDECNTLYGRKPGDDATACVLKIRKRVPMNLLFGPPSNRDDVDRMMSLFFAKKGKHIVCGGTTTNIAAGYLKKPVRTSLHYSRSDIPPIAKVEGIDLATEGVITMNRVLEYAKDHINEDLYRQEWANSQDGASQICRLLFEEATDISFYVGKAVNPAHQNPDLPINFNIKMNIVENLSECLRKMGKRVKLSYF